MNIRSAFIISTAILFLSAPAWGDSLKVKSSGNWPNAIHFDQSWHSYGHSNIKFLGGFKPESNKHTGVFNFKEDHFVLVVPGGNFDQPGGWNDCPTPDPVSTPEPAALSMLLVGFVALGAFAFRRSPFLVGAN